MKQVFKRFLSLALSMLMVLSLLPAGVLSVTAYAASNGEVTGLGNENIGLSYSGDKTDTWTANGTTVTGSIQSSSGCGTTHYSSTLTITNKRSITATLSFDYAIDAQGGTIQVDGTAVTAGGTFSKELAAGETVTVYIKSNSTSAPTKITLSNLALSANVEATATFLPAENGSYTVDGKAITEEFSNTQNAMNAYKLAATPASGYQFRGWYNVTTGEYLGTNTTLTLNVESDCTITAKFLAEDANLFEVGTQTYEDLGEAVTYAQANKISQITLLSKKATLTKDYTIPAGITLLVPHDAAKTLFLDTPTALTPGHQAATKKNEFRSLTLAEGVTLTVEGGLSVGGQYQSASGGSNSYMSGDYGQVWLNAGSNITVKSGGNLYAWGFVSGAGSVTVKSGGTVYEWYQILDFRGGSATLGIGNKVFPFNQYDIQNVESAMTLEQGATETAYAAVYASSRINTSAIPFIGDSGMFKIVSGSLTKMYDGTTDRNIYTVNGEAEVNNLNLELAGSSVNSKNYVLPLTNNMTVNLTEGSKLTVNQTAALLPGVQANIASGAELEIAKGTTVYVYDQDEWGGYCDTYSLKFKAVGYAPSRTYNRTEKDLVDAKVDVNGTLTVNETMYTTKSGADICSSEKTGVFKQNAAPGTETETYQYTQSGSKVTAHEIPITPAKLHNADDSYTETANAKAGDVAKYVTDKWVINPCTITFDANGGKGTMEPITESAGTERSLPECAFTREGYEFTGWNTTPDGKGDSYAAGADFTLADNIILYAQWECRHEKTELRDAKDATCTEDGYTGDTYCSTCGEKLRTGEIITAKGHTEVIDEAVKATCTTPGKTEGKHCSVCREILVAQEEIPAKGHIWDKGEITTAPTCKDAGVKTYTCTVCSETKTEAVDATGHTPVEVGELAPTCTKPGHEAGIKCSVCNAILSGMKEIPATGHTEVIDAAVEPTCTEPGKTEGKHCSVCNEILVAQEEIPAKGHTPIEVAEQPATCTEAGHTAGTKCSVCGTTISGMEEIPATGHTEVIDEAVAATCTASGKTEGKHCSVCNEILVAQEVVPAKGHTEEVRNAKEATLTEDGYTGDTYCSVCNTQLAQGEVIPKTGVTITWIIVDGETTIEVYKRGDMPSYKGATTKEETPRYTYSFAWDKEIVEAIEDTTYTGTFTAIGKNGLCVEGDDTFWIKDGENVKFPGLIRIDINEGTGEQPHYHYYYFGEDGKAVKDGDYKVDKNNDLPLPCYKYHFDKDGIIEHDKDTSKKGIAMADSGSDHYFIDGVKVGEGLICVDGKYYYARTSTGEIVRNQGYWIAKNNGLPVPAGMYHFDADGVMQINGFVTVRDGTYYHENGTLAKGFTKIGDDYYFFNKDTGKMYKDADMWVGENDYGFSGGIYHFGADGKMVIPDTVNGEKKIVTEDGKLYFTIDGARMYSGLYELNGAYYYARANGQLVVNDVAYIDATPLNGEGWYGFDAEGKLIMTGFVTGGGYTYYYNNGKRALGFTQIGEDYYFFNASSGKMYTDATLWVTANEEGGIKGGMYYFGTDGKMVTHTEPDLEHGVKKIVEESGNLYFTIDEVRMYNGLYELDGNYYFAKYSGELAVNEIVYAETALVDGNGWYAFGEEGKLIMTGFVTGGGYTYYYNNGKRALGFTEIGEDYYFFNAVSGKMYTDATLWVGANDYGIEGGMHRFGTDGKMANS